MSNDNNTQKNCFSITIKVGKLNIESEEIGNIKIEGLELKTESELSDRSFPSFIVYIKEYIEKYFDFIKTLFPTDKEI